MGDVIQLGKKACTHCGHAAGGHFDECPRSAVNMRRLVQIRQDKIARGEIVARGGRKRKLRLTQKQLDEIATKTASEMLYGDRAEAVLVLRKQMSSKDERIAQKAALEILAYTDGKPTQRVETTSDNVTEVVYRTAALAYEEFVPDTDAETG